MKPDIIEVLAQVADERMAQDEKWGEQNHPVHGSEPSVAWFNLVASEWKLRNDRRVKDGSLAWDGILLEEVYEALAETDPDKQIEELVQVAAVAVAAIESITRNRA